VGRAYKEKNGMSSLPPDAAHMPRAALTNSTDAAIQEATDLAAANG